MNVQFNYDCYLTDINTSDVISRVFLRMQSSIDFVPQAGFEFRFSNVWATGEDLCVAVESCHYLYDEDLLMVDFTYNSPDTNDFSMLISGLTELGWEIDDEPPEVEEEEEEEDEELEDETIV